MYLCPAESTGALHGFPLKRRHSRRKERIQRISTARGFNPDNLRIPPFPTVIRRAWYGNREIMDNDATNFETSQCFLASVAGFLSLIARDLLRARQRDNQ